MSGGWITHPNPQIDAILGAVVGAGGELDASDPQFVKALCLCENDTHAVFVMKEFQGNAYVGRIVKQFAEHPCLGKRIMEGGEV